VLVFVEDVADELSRQAVAFSRGLGEEVQAVGFGEARYAPAAWARSLVSEIERRAPAAVIAPGSDRGHEVLAHVGAILDQPFAANCSALTLGEPARVTRMRWGGSLFEEAVVHGSPVLASVAPHVVAADGGLTQAEVLSAGDDPVFVSERVQAQTAGVSLADAEVVVSGGRGVGSAEGFVVIEELAQLLGAAVGCSRAVTSAGWRPHTDQVGQTGTKISPEIYIACGISGATQHMAGCKGAKKLLAINPDAEASIFANADYAVIGDLHEVVPAISAEIRKARGT
jgi:electron transfer flavoprotein alpha subunit